MRLTRPLLALIGLLIAVATACSGGADKPSTTEDTAAVSYPFSVTDASGASIELPSEPRRIVSLSPAITETLFAVGAGSQVIAVDRFSYYPPETASLPKLEYSRPTPEPVLALTPDLVFMTTRQSGQIDQFRAVGLKVAFLEEPVTIEDTLKRIELIGRITGHAREAKALSTDMTKRIDVIKTQVATVAQSPLVFYEIGPEGYTASPNSFIGSLLTLVRARNIAEGASSAFPQLSVETILNANPEVILLSDASEQAGGQSATTVRARPGWAAVSAVRNGRIYPVDPDIFNRAGPRIVDAIELLVKTLYPQLDVKGR